jgi:hypothetical protein
MWIMGGLSILYLFLVSPSLHIIYSGFKVNTPLFFDTIFVVCSLFFFILGMAIYKYKKWGRIIGIGVALFFPFFPSFFFIAPFSSITCISYDPTIINVLCKMFLLVMIYTLLCLTKGWNSALPNPAAQRD